MTVTDIPVGTSVYGPAAGAALGVAGQLAASAQMFRSASAHNNATMFVNNFEAPLGEALKQASALANTDPAQAQAILQPAYDNYMQAVNFFKNFDGGGLSTIVNQSLSNQALQQTINSVSSAVGLTAQNGKLVSSIPTQNLPDYANPNPTADPAAADPSVAENYASPSGGGVSGPSGVGDMLTQLLGPTIGAILAATTGNGTLKSTTPGTNGTDPLKNPTGATSPTAIPGGTPAASPGAASNPNDPTVSTNSTLKSLLPLLLGGAAVGTDIYGAISGSNAQKEAAQIQADAATKAAQLSSDTAKASIAEQARQFDTTQANQAPWLSNGTDAIDRLGQMLKDGTFSPYSQSFNGNPDGTLFTGNPSVNQQFTANPNTAQQFNGNPNVNQDFTRNPDVLTAPQFDDKFSFTADDMLKDPGYQRRLADSQQALERAASSKGNLFSPGTSAEIAGKVGAQASDEFGTAYSRAQQDYLNKYNVFEGNAASKNAAAQGNFTNAANETTMNNSSGQQNLANALNINNTNNQSSQTNFGNASTQTQQNNAANQTNYGNAANQNVQNNNTLNQNFQNELAKFMNGYNIYNTDQSNLFNRNAAVSGIGQTAAGAVQSAGQNMVNQNGTTSQNSTVNINDLMTQLANSQANSKINQNATTTGGINNVSDDLASLLHSYLSKAA